MFYGRRYDPSCVGQSSLIYCSPDAGGSWEMVSFFPSSNVSTVENIVQVSFRHLWGYAHPFLVIHSSGGGITRSSQKTYPSTMMRRPWWSQYRYQIFQTSRGSVFLFLDSLHAMVIRGQFLRDDVGNMILTSDGGETFVPIEFRNNKIIVVDNGNSPSWQVCSGRDLLHRRFELLFCLSITQH